MMLRSVNPIMPPSFHTQNIATSVLSMIHILLGRHRLFNLRNSIIQFLVLLCNIENKKRKKKRMPGNFVGILSNIL